MKLRTGQALGSTAFRQLPRYYDLVRRRCLMPSRHACSLPGSQGNSDFSCSIQKPVVAFLPALPRMLCDRKSGHLSHSIGGLNRKRPFSASFLVLTRLPSLVHSIQLDNTYLQESWLLRFLIAFHQKRFRLQQHKVVCKLLLTVVCEGPTLCRLHGSAGQSFRSTSARSPMTLKSPPSFV